MPARSPRRRRRGTGAALLRVAAGGALLAAAVAFVPPLRTTALAWGDTTRSAIAAARLAEARDARIAAYALRYGISPGLAADIERAAIAEGIDPDLAFRLIRVESGFHERAVSPAGALGLTQLMPATAEWLHPGITREEIFRRETNLRLGMRYLRLLLDTYDGRLDEALHAYNRGPGTVDRIRAEGGDPANGYAERVLGRGGSAYRGTGVVPPFPAATADR